MIFCTCMRVVLAGAKLIILKICLMNVSTVPSSQQCASKTTFILPKRQHFNILDFMLRLAKVL